MGMLYCKRVGADPFRLNGAMVGGFRCCDTRAFLTSENTGIRQSNFKTEKDDPAPIQRGTLAMFWVFMMNIK